MLYLYDQVSSSQECGSTDKIRLELNCTLHLLITLIFSRPLSDMLTPTQSSTQLLSRPHLRLNRLISPANVHTTNTMTLTRQTPLKTRTNSYYLRVTHQSVVSVHTKFYRELSAQDCDPARHNIQALRCRDRHTFKRELEAGRTMANAPGWKEELHLI